MPWVPSSYPPFFGAAWCWLIAAPLPAGEPPSSPPPTSVMVAPAEPDWSLSVGLPVWAAGLSGDVGLEGYEPVAVNLPFEKILSHLDMVAALTLEARHQRWGFIADGMYLKMSTSGETPGRLLRSVDVQIEQVLAEVAVSYRLIEGERGYLDLLAGARYMHLTSEMNFHLDDAGVREVSQDLSNAILSRTVDAIQGEVSRTVSQLQSQLAVLGLDERAGALRGELRTGAIEKILEERALRDIVQAIRDLTPAQRELIRRKIENSRDIAAANKALAQAVISEKVSAAAATVRRRGQQAVAKARKQLASAIESAIREAVPEEVSGSKGWVDPFVGFRGRLLLTDKLYVAARGDVGGFSVGSDLTWNVSAACGFQWTKSFSTELGYRHLVVDYADGGFVFDTEMSGIFLGMTFRL